MNYKNNKSIYQFYDLLFKDKPYREEANYIEEIVLSHIHIDNKTTSKWTEIGCGTGRYTTCFKKKSYDIQGIDIDSTAIEIAKNTNSEISFFCNDAQHFKTEKKQNVILSLFYVMSYFTDNTILLNVFKQVYENLEKGGIFVFDFYYASGVLRSFPTEKKTILYNEEYKLESLLTPVMNCLENQVELNYKLNITSNKNERFVIYDTHKMRYFLDKEMEMICDLVGLKVLEKRAWMTEKQPDFDTWKVIWCVQKT